jgi:hypothetical protein
MIMDSTSTMNGILLLIIYKYEAGLVLEDQGRNYCVIDL